MLVNLIYTFDYVGQPNHKDTDGLQRRLPQSQQTTVQPLTKPGTDKLKEPSLQRTKDGDMGHGPQNQENRPGQIREGHHGREGGFGVTPSYAPHGTFNRNTGKDKTRAKFPMRTPPRKQFLS